MSSLREHYSHITGEDLSFILRNATTDGLLGGNDAGNVNGSATPVKLYVQPPLGQTFIVSRASFAITDNGAPSIFDYGNIPGPLVKGVQLFTEIEGVENNFGIPIVSNRQLANLGPDEYVRISFEANTALAIVTFDVLAVAQKSGIRLRGDTNDKFGMIIQDDLSSLISHNLVIAGRRLIGN